MRKKNRSEKQSTLTRSNKISSGVDDANKRKLTCSIAIAAPNPNPKIAYSPSATSISIVTERASYSPNSLRQQNYYRQGRLQALLVLERQTLPRFSSQNIQRWSLARKFPLKLHQLPTLNFLTFQRKPQSHSATKWMLSSTKLIWKGKKDKQPREKWK